MLDEEDRYDAWGAVLEEGRGSLPFALVHGEALVACASWALGRARITPVDLGTPWPDVVAAEVAFVLHDPLCPLTPPEFLAACVTRAQTTGRVVVGVRPVTDTVKLVRTGLVGRTLDRTSLHALASPVVLPAAVVAALAGPPGPSPQALLAGLAGLERRFGVERVAAPAAARRVAGPGDLRVLAALTAPR